MGARWRVRAVTALALAAAVPMVGLGRLGTGAVDMIPAPPRIGPVHTVDRDDIGDPDILAVAPGVALPPSLRDDRSTRPEMPWMSTDPWTVADSVAAEARGWYVLFATTDWRSNIPVAVSTDLVHWSAAPDALPVLPVWARPSVAMTWAPAATRVGSGYVLYFSTETRSSHQECIGAATSSRPAGPYTDHADEPLVCQRHLGGSIDPSVVHLPGGRDYLVWKNDGNSRHVLDSLWSAPLTPDGLALSARPDRLMSADEAWDDGVVEAPAMIPAARGGWWLFYAAGGWDTTSYATGLAYCPSIHGPCLPTSALPYLATTRTMVSPGGLDTVSTPGGQLWAAWSALQPERVPWARGAVWYDRVLEIARVLRR